MLSLLINYSKSRSVKDPVYGSSEAAGIDLFVPNDVAWESKVLQHGESVKIPSGIHFKLPDHVCLVVTNRSGLGSKGLNVGACLIDPDYTGEVHINVFNQSKEPITIRANEKLVQLLALPFYRFKLEQVENIATLKETERGNKGFGSTDNNDTQHEGDL